MPRIIEEKFYNGAMRRISRLGLSSLLDEVRTILTGFELLIAEQKNANGSAVVRKQVDQRFQAAGGWQKVQTGDVDWTKCQVIDNAKRCLGVEIAVSSRSDMVSVDLLHLEDALREGEIDVGILVVPSDRFSTFLTDRTPSLSAVERHIFRVQHLPLLVIAIEHDGPGASLAKQKRRAP